MASGDSVVQVIREMPPDATVATLDTRGGGSTPGEVVVVRDFDASTQEYLDFLCKLEGYSGGGLTFTLPWSASTATANGVVWGVAIRRVQDDAEDIDTSHTYDYNKVTDTAPTVSGEISYPTVTFTDGADMDSWAEGEVGIIRVSRFTGDGGDDMTGDAELWAIFGLET
jgi:hypothetical protein